MKKTISVNLKGINFIMEEDAYNLLQNYLERLRSALGKENVHQETLEDIELRIAELCSGKLNESKTVIELADIESIIKVMGEPEDYMSEEDEKPREKEPKGEAVEKRLFRDQQRAAIAGVCAGIANYLNIDVVIIRAIFVIMFLTVGFGIPLYIILWIIIPKAKSSIDRLRMRGRPITVESVRSEVEGAAQNISRGGRRVARDFRHGDSYTRSVSKGVRVLSQLFGIGLIAIGIILLIPFIIFIVGGFGIIPIDGEPALLSFPEFGKLILSTTADYRIMWIGVLLVGFSVILFFVLSGSLLIFRIKNLWTKLSLFGLFLAGLTGFILVATIGLSTGKDYYFGGEVKTKVGSFVGTQLTVLAQPDDKRSSENGAITLSSKAPGILTIRDGYIQSSGIDIEFIPSPDSMFHITQVNSARGRSEFISLKRAGNIRHHASLSNDSLLVGNLYVYPENDKLRAQKVELIIEIPHGSSVLIDDRIIRLGEKANDKSLLNADDFEVKGRMKHNGEFKIWD